MANFDLNPPATDLISGPAGGADFSQIGSKVVGGAVQYYDALNAINAAKYQSKILKAQAQSAVAATKAGGIYGAEAARIGLPSPTLLLVGGLALAALMIVKR